MARKFSVGDKVTVIKLDQKLIHEEYDQIGIQYRALLFQTGEITSIYSDAGVDRYTVLFFPFKEFDAWYMYDDQMIAYNPDLNYETLGVLYGPKEV